MPPSKSRKDRPDRPGEYRFSVQSFLDERWSERLGDLRISTSQGSEGQVTMQLWERCLQIVQRADSSNQGVFGHAGRDKIVGRVIAPAENTIAKTATLARSEFRFLALQSSQNVSCYG